MMTGTDGKLEPTPQALSMIPREVADKYDLLPLAVNGSTLVVAMARPGDAQAIDDVQFLTGMTVDAVPSAQDAVREAIGRSYVTWTAADSVSSSLAHMFEDEIPHEEAPTVDLL